MTTATITRALILDGWAWCGSVMHRHGGKLCRVFPGTGSVELKCKCGAVNLVELTLIVTDP